MATKNVWVTETGTSVEKTQRMYKYELNCGQINHKGRINPEPRPPNWPSRARPSRGNMDRVGTTEETIVGFAVLAGLLLIISSAFLSIFFCKVVFDCLESGSSLKPPNCNTRRRPPSKSNSLKCRPELGPPRWKRRMIIRRALL